MPKPELAEPRLAPVFDVYLKVSETTDALLAAIEAQPHINTDAYCEALKAFMELGFAAGRVMVAVMALKRTGRDGHNAFCDAITNTWKKK